MASTYTELVEKSWARNILFSALVELTYRCNWDCFFCYNDLSLRGKPLSLEQYFAFLADLHDMQVMNLILSGGEPLTHPDFFAIGARARELGFVVRIKSNAHALSGTLARRVRDEIDPFIIEVSLHGATPETHDRQTRIAGSFNRLITNIREMKELGLRLKANAPLTAWNETEIEGMAQIGDELGIQVQFDPVVTPRDDGDLSPLQIAPSQDAVLNLFVMQRQRFSEAQRAAPGKAPRVPEIGREAESGMGSPGPKKHCGAGSSGITVDPYGSVYPCVQWRIPVGNLHEESIKTIWDKNQRLDEIREREYRIKERIDAMGPGASAMGFCPGLAETLTGDPLAIYPAAERKREAFLEAERLVPLEEGD